jgi:hypothetical protein
MPQVAIEAAFHQDMSRLMLTLHMMIEITGSSRHSNSPNHLSNNQQHEASS